MATLGLDYISKTYNPKDAGKACAVKIWDTAGQERYRSLAPMYYRGAKAAVVVYDITNEDTFKGAKSWVKELKTKTTNSKVGGRWEK